MIRTVFPEAVIIGRDEFQNALILQPKLVIALGGDNHAQWVSHGVPKGAAFMGLNSDPAHSLGAVLQGDTTELPKLREQLLKGEFRFQPSTRLRVDLNGAVLPLALSDVYIGDRQRMNISRYYLNITHGLTGSSDAPLERKDSGMLIATGTGSRGWFQSAVRAQFHFSPQFDPAAEGAAYHSTESFLDPDMQSGTGVIVKGDIIHITSRFNRTGVIAIDAQEETTFDFPRGSVATITIEPDPLWVVVGK